MGLTDRLNAIVPVRRSVTQYPPALPSYDNLWPYLNFGGNTYPFGLNQTIRGHAEDIDGSFAGLVRGAYKSNGIVFACMLARQQLFSEARFQFQRLEKGRPGKLWGDSSLDVLDHPWFGGITTDLLARAIQDVDLAGNFFCTRRGPAIHDFGRIG